MQLPFLASAVYRLLQTRLEDSAYTPQSLFQNLHNQNWRGYDTQVIPQKSPKKAHSPYRLLGIPSPMKLPAPITSPT